MRKLFLIIKSIKKKWKHELDEEMLDDIVNDIPMSVNIRKEYDKEINNLKLKVMIAELDFLHLLHSNLPKHSPRKEYLEKQTFNNQYDIEINKLADKLIDDLPDLF